MATEDKFPTIRDLRDRLSMIVDEGLGDLPVQLVVVPDSTLQAMERRYAEWSPMTPPALMIEFPARRDCFGVSFIAADRYDDPSLPVPRGDH